MHTEHMLARGLQAAETLAAAAETDGSHAQHQGLMLTLSYAWKLHIMRGAAKASAQCQRATVSVTDPGV